MFFSTSIPSKLKNKNVQPAAEHIDCWGFDQRRLYSCMLLILYVKKRDLFNHTSLFLPYRTTSAHSCLCPASCSPRRCIHKPGNVSSAIPDIQQPFFFFTHTWSGDNSAGIIQKEAFYHLLRTASREEPSALFWGEPLQEKKKPQNNTWGVEQAKRLFYFSFKGSFWFYLCGM